MSIAELKIKLFEMEVPHYCYSVGADDDQRTCLVEENGKWLVYYNEDGERMDLVEHSTESDACDDMLKRLAE